MVVCIVLFEKKRVGNSLKLTGIGYKRVSYFFMSNCRCSNNPTWFVHLRNLCKYGGNNELLRWMIIPFLLVIIFFHFKLCGECIYAVLHLTFAFHW